MKLDIVIISVISLQIFELGEPVGVEEEVGFMCKLDKDAMNSELDSTTSNNCTGVLNPRNTTCKSTTEVNPRNTSNDSNGEVKSRSFVLNSKLHWPKGVVPYVMDKKFTSKEVAFIKAMFQTFRNVSCVKWEPRKKEKDYVEIVRVKDKNVCNSRVGRRGGRQLLRLGENCFHPEKGFPGAILHEMMHTVGFIHEQQRMDRDCYVKILIPSVIEKRPYDYAITLQTLTEFPYDLHSIMHYGTSVRMKPLKEGEMLGNDEGKLTDMDVMKLNRLYCGGKSYCQLKPQECKKLLEVEKKCKINEKSKGHYIKQ